MVGSCLVDDEADADDEVVADALADRFMHHQPEAAALLDRTAELVAAPIGGRREELADEMGTGEGLDAVETAFLAPRRSLGEVGHDTCDVVLVHLLGEGPVQRLAHGRRADGCQCSPRIRLAAPTHVAHLAHQCGAVGVDAPRKLLEMLDDALVVQVDLR